MQHAQTVLETAERLSHLIEEKIGPRGPDLKRQVARAGRRLPRAVRREVLTVAHAVDLAQHPKLAAQINLDTIAQAETRATEHLQGVDPADRRRGALLAIAGSNAFNILAIGALVVIVLRWRGLV